MKKFTLFLSVLFCSGIVNAQTMLYDNGPLINSPGVGLGGADVSSLHSGINTLGLNHSVSIGYVIADDFTVPTSGWTIDSMVFFAYQTQSGNTSTINEVRIGIWDASPELGGNIIYGDTGVNAMIDSYWSGIYRTSEVALTNADRPIMRDVVETPGLVLNSGVYFVSWQTGGTLASGPWAPMITITGVTTTGDAIQFVPSTGLWQPAKDTTTTAPGGGTGAIQGFPFLIYGHVTVGISENNQHASDFAINNMRPVPVTDMASFTIQSNKKGNVIISVMDYLGREVKAEPRDLVNGENDIRMNLSDLNAGVYFITVKNERSIVVSKFVKD